MKPSKRSRKAQPTVIDLYAGVGGLSLGAARAGFDIVGAVETDRIALSTHKRNFPKSVHIEKDVGKLSGKRLLQLTKLKQGALDGLIGGPPCQGFSYIGKNNAKDSRNALFHHFFRLVKELQPKFFLAENVPGILSEKFDDLRRAALTQIVGDYTMLEPIRINASEYGAATSRTRIFFIGYKTAHFNAMSSRSFEPSPNESPVMVRNALSGLPLHIDPIWSDGSEGWRPLRKVMKTSFLKGVSGNIPKGIGDLIAIERYQNKGEVSGCMGTDHEKKVIRRFAALKPGEQDPVSRAYKLNPRGFCPTLRAGTGSDRGSYQAIRPIHFREPRVITPREAARLQGFPDWFVFHKTKWHSFRQIGNSVSPVIAEFLLARILAHLRQ